MITSVVHLFKCETRSGKGGVIKKVITLNWDNTLIDIATADADTVASYVFTRLLKRARAIATPSVNNTEENRAILKDRLLEILSDYERKMPEIVHEKWVISHNDKKAFLGTGKIEVVSPAVVEAGKYLDVEGGRATTIFVRFQFERTKHWYGGWLYLARHKERDCVADPALMERRPGPSGEKIEFNMVDLTWKKVAGSEQI